jgi:hypothetical protein
LGVYGHRHRDKKLSIECDGFFVRRFSHGPTRIEVLKKKPNMGIFESSALPTNTNGFLPPSINMMSAILVWFATNV